MLHRVAIVCPFLKTSTCMSTATLAVRIDHLQWASITDCTKGHKKRPVRSLVILYAYQATGI